MAQRDPAWKSVKTLEFQYVNHLAHDKLIAGIGVHDSVDAPSL
jgi:hypothetical protein